MYSNAKKSNTEKFIRDLIFVKRCNNNNYLRRGYSCKSIFPNLNLERIYKKQVVCKYSNIESNNSICINKVKIIISSLFFLLRNS